MSFRKIIKKILDFRNKRNWKKFHSPKNLAISVSIEAAELLEKFQWLNEQESLAIIKDNQIKKEIADEIVDVLWYLLLLAYDLDIDIENAFKNKILENNKKYPIKKVKEF